MPEDTQHDKPRVNSAASPAPASEGEAGPVNENNPPAAKPLTAEEQMALYEEDLKESDWGHQPC